MLLIIAVSTFVCGVLTVMGIYWMAYRPKSAASERIEVLEAQGGTHVAVFSAKDTSPVVDLAQRVAEPINRLVPASAAEAEKLRIQLMQAGIRSRNAPLIYSAIQLGAM